MTHGPSPDCAGHRTLTLAPLVKAGTSLALHRLHFAFLILSSRLAQIFRSLVSSTVVILPGKTGIEGTPLCLLFCLQRWCPPSTSSPAKGFSFLFPSRGTVSASETRLARQPQATIFRGHARQLRFPSSPCSHRRDVRQQVPSPGVWLLQPLFKKGEAQLGGPDFGSETE